MIKKLKFIWEHKDNIINHLKLIWKYYIVNDRDDIQVSNECYLDCSNFSDKDKKEAIKETKKILLQSLKYELRTGCFLWKILLNLNFL